MADKFQLVTLTWGYSIRCVTSTYGLAELIFIKKGKVTGDMVERILEAVNQAYESGRLEQKLNTSEQRSQHSHG